MAEQAAHLVDTVLPHVPVRQWVLSVPHRLRYRLAFDHPLCRAERVRHRRVGRLLRRRGLTDTDDPDAADPLAQESLALASIASAAVQGRMALGPHAGARVLQVGRDPHVPWVTSAGPRQAQLEGFDLHADVAVAAEDRSRLEPLCRYVLRPPVAQERLTLQPDGRVLVTLKAEWHDGTTHLCLEPLTLLERLAALTPRPRANLVVYHGVLAPHATWRRAVVGYGRPVATVPAEGDRSAEATAEPRHPTQDTAEPSAKSANGADATTGGGAGAVSPAARARRFSWAELLRHVFALDVLACPRCGGRMRVLATIEDPAVIRRIPTHLGLPVDEPVPARAPPNWDE